MPLSASKIIPVLLAALKMKRSWGAVAAVLAATWFFTGSATSSVDWMWKEPRDLLVDRVEDARDVQAEAAEEFRDALTEFKAVVDVPASELEKRYNTLAKTFDRTEAAANDVSGRIDKVVAASNRLLEEWRGELGDYKDPKLRRRAEEQFDATRSQAERLIETLRASEARMNPVLDAFRDQVLYLKHNLNLSAIAALDGEAAVIESDVDALIGEMQAAIAEADAFIATLATAGG